MVKVNLIVAFDSNYGISKDNDMPWHFKEDFIRFRNVTTELPNSAVIMGRNTWNSLPKKGLINRVNIVISSTMSYDVLASGNETEAQVYLINSLDNALLLCDSLNIEKVFIIGGSNLYYEALAKELTCGNFIDRICITKICGDYQCDNFFPYDLYVKLYSNKSYFIDYEFNYKQTCLDTKNNKQIELYYTTEKLTYINKEEQNYLNLVKKVMDTGCIKQTRNGNTLSVFSEQLIFDLANGFPLLTTKKMFWKGIVEELLFFIKGCTNANLLSDKGVHIWDGNTTSEFHKTRNLNYESGDMGPMYGWNWRHFGATYSNMDADYNGTGYDQLKNVINLLLNDKNSRRIVMTTYDPSKVEQAVLPPCHGLCVQFYVENNLLHCKMYQRSVDVVLGLPFNIASYALLMILLCKVTMLQPGKLIIDMGDIHIYDSHIDGVKMQLDRIPYKFPKVSINKPFESSCVDDAVTYLENISIDDITLDYYVCHPAVKIKMVI